MGLWARAAERFCLAGDLLGPVNARAVESSVAHYAVQAPVALFIHRRPETTARVIAAIHSVRPRLLLVVADGPRAERPGEVEACADARAIVDTVDWPCEVRRQFAPANMGCRARVSSGLQWVFDQVPEAIVLEDDCLPDPTFFQFCDQLLGRYRDDHRVAQVCGANNQKGRRRGRYSYFFSRYNNVWGWASWRRALERYDAEMSAWPVLRDERWLEGILETKAAVRYWTSVFEATYGRRIDTWDYQWVFSSWVHGMVSVVPNRNLVSNIGFDSWATHTSRSNVYAGDPLEQMDFPLTHPASVVRDGAADSFSERLEYSRTLFARIRAGIERRVRDYADRGMLFRSRELR